MTFRDLTEDDVLRVSAGFDEPEWLRDRRLEAFKAFSDLEWPRGEEEEWRYTNPKRLGLEREVLTGAAQTPALASGIVGTLSDSYGMVRIVDAGVVTATVCAEAQEQAVVVTDLASAARDHADLVRKHLGTAVGTETKFDALNLAAFTNGAFVYVPANVELPEPIAITVQAATDGATAPRVLVVLGENVRAKIYVDHTGDAAATVVEVVEIVVGAGARADVVTAQDWGDNVDHIGAHTGLVGSNGDYRHLEISLGGKTVYLRPDVRLDNPGGNGELLGVYFCDEGQHVEHRSLIHHNASHTTSNLIYKGALQGDSRATFYGTIRIEEHAKATASDETNRNLILTDRARADSIPVLEILNSDVVRCGHHSSVGQVDELQMFYLESRGIPREEAARLLVFGFFAEVTDRIDLPGITEIVLSEVEREIRSGPTALMNQRRS
ncbi:MAG: Fe-S cluster assembly protein SufD [Nitriliruptorales bacterium]|nr:Fe-S cluster assembly protein SufD [Nitriliruptorales bacterium]